MEESFDVALDDRFQSWGVGEPAGHGQPSCTTDEIYERKSDVPENAEARLARGRAYDSNGLSKHDLIRGVRVQVERGHEARLCGVGVDLRSSRRQLRARGGR